MVWQVLAMLERGESWDYVRSAWPGRVNDEAIAETIRLARTSLLDKHGLENHKNQRRISLRRRHHHFGPRVGPTTQTDCRTNGIAGFAFSR